MNKRNLTYIEIICHLLFWFIPVYLSIKFNLVQFGEQLSNKYAYMPFIANTLFNILLVYTNIFILFPIYTRKKLNRLQYASLIFIIVLLSALIKYEINNFFSWYYFSKMFIKVLFGEMFLTEFIIASFFTIQSILYCAVKEWIKDSIVTRKLAEEKLTLELNYLKAQINPHFLFNTLNNLYAVALKNNDNETANGITKLSNIMRFMLNDVNETMIPLEKEINYLKSYLDLQRLRFSAKDDIKISFDIQGDPANIKIPPFIFIVFIENAFKYGINYKKHSFINIQFAIFYDKLRFNIKNSIHNTNELQSSGIGLKNIKERLELLYPGRYNLEITSEDNIFNVDLSIKLSAKR
jgi:sensor histidine kinase YesM